MTRETPDDLREFTVLVIEDNEGDFVLIEDYLLEKFINITVVHCSNFDNSIAYLKKNPEKIAIILMDLNLPEFSGIDLITRILSFNFEIPIVILTGYADLQMAKKSLQLGIYDYLLKDEINPIVLHKTITFTLNRNSFIKQIEQEKQNYENLFNFNPQPTWLIDAKTLKILNANLAAQIKYGLSQHDFLKMTFLQLHPADEENLIKKNLRSKEDDSTRNNFTHLLGDGKKIKVNIYCTEINSNSQSRLIVQSNDISETINHINTIEIQNEKLKSIAWTQSHIVRAPISRILGIINLLEEEQDGSRDEMLFWMKQLKISTTEMDAIVKKIVNEANSF